MPEKINFLQFYKSILKDSKWFFGYFDAIMISLFKKMVSTSWVAVWKRCPSTTSYIGKYERLILHKFESRIMTWLK